MTLNERSNLLTGCEVWFVLEQFRAIKIAIPSFLLYLHAQNIQR